MTWLVYMQAPRGNTVCIIRHDGQGARQCLHARRLEQRLAPLHATGRRPTFFPGSRLQRLAKAAALQDPTMRMLCCLANTLADLAHPKAALRVLADLPRLSAYEAAIQAALQERPGGQAMT